MQALSFEGSRPLPETLLDDLRELLTWDNNCLLTWSGMGTETDPEGARWFTVKLSSDGERFALRLEFWIPEWMSERGVAAILPAHLQVEACRPGEWAAVDLGLRTWSELEASLPRVARTCARLINELWGPTEGEDVLLLTIDYQDEQLPLPFSELPGFRR
ncbi:MAG TPA: hypothetical protein VNL98_04110 [Gemmatimonadales bacterium]|nr:hypothetical protein [Gemmatimonadales bacterium]